MPMAQFRAFTLNVFRNDTQDTPSICHLAFAPQQHVLCLSALTNHCSREVDPMSEPRILVELY